ncbi:hypothetical protein HDU97_003659 [Phlyctochytrium planicorne]|nr:hypothetical protein HDU97_003659 [Phlyctochytrium planicorne]
MSNNQYQQPSDIEMQEAHEIDPNTGRPRGLKKFVKEDLKKTGKAVGSVAQDFINFLKRGNVVDLAVGVVMGAAFTAIVNSVVNDLITPIIGLATENNLENTFVVIKCKKVNGIQTDQTCKVGSQGNYTTVAIANAAGAITINWGRFIQIVINFIIIAAIIYFFVKIYSNTFLRVVPKPAPKTRPCDYCLEDIKVGATRCKFCGSEQNPQPAATPGPSSTPPPSLFANMKNVLVPNHERKRA